MDIGRIKKLLDSKPPSNRLDSTIFFDHQKDEILFTVLNLLLMADNGNCIDNVSQALKQLTDEELKTFCSMFTSEENFILTIVRFDTFIKTLINKLTSKNE